METDNRDSAQTSTHEYSRLSPPTSQNQEFEDSTWENEYHTSFKALCLIGFLDAVEYGCIMPSLYGYLEQMNDHSGLSEDALSHQYGIILSIFSAASLVSKPFLGYLGDTRPFLETFIWSTLVATVGNILYFSTLFLVENVTGEGNSAPFWWLLSCRILAGVGCANTSLTFAYVARTVEANQRTQKMTTLSLVKITGMLMGPGFNAITAKIDFSIGNFKIDEYNSPGAVVAVFQVAALIFVSLVLKEPPPYDESNLGQSREGVDQSNSSTVSITGPLILCFFNIVVYNFFFGTLETVTTPIAETAFGWSPLQISFVFMSLTLVAVLLTIFVMVTSKFTEDRTFLVVAGICAVAATSWSRIFYYYDMSKLTFVIGVTLWACPAALAFSSNRSLFSRLIEGSQKQALLSSLLSVLASVGGILGPNWVGFALGHKPDASEDKHIKVAPEMYSGVFILSALVLIANIMLLFLMPTTEPILAHESTKVGLSHDELEANLLPTGRTEQTVESS